MSKILTITLLALSFCLQTFSQCTCASQTVIPDSAFNGKVAGFNGACVTYKLNKPLVAGVAYNFTCYLSGLIACGSPCSCYAQSQIYFGMSACDETGQEKVINGGNPIPDGLNNYSFAITPYGCWTYISFVNYFNPAWSPACSGQFTIDSFSVSSPATPLTVSIQLDNGSCPLDSNGRAVVHATGIAPFTYLWSNGGTDSILQHVPADTFEVKVIDATGCIAYDTVIIPHQQPAPATITVHGDTLMSIPAASYQWYLNGNAIAGATSQNYVAQQNGTYDAIIKDSTGCTSSASNYIPIVNITGITTALNTANIRLYPNPATNTVTIYSDNQPMTLKMFDLTSREIISKEMNGNVNNLDVSSLTKGMYLIKISQGQKHYSQKLIIQ